MDVKLITYVLGHASNLVGDGSQREKNKSLVCLLYSFQNILSFKSLLL